jgi:hypothetical protein
VLDIDPDLDIISEEAPNTFLTTFEELVPSGATAVSAALTNRAFTYALTPGNTTQDLGSTTYTTSVKSRYSLDVFRGIVINTGASTKSTTGLGQFQALQRTAPAMELELDTSTRGQVTVQFGVGSATLIGTANVYTPVGQVEFYMVNTSTPFLLYLADMNKLRVYYDNIQDVLVTPTKEVPVVR